MLSEIDENYFSQLTSKYFNFSVPCQTDIYVPRKMSAEQKNKLALSTNIIYCYVFMTQSRIHLVLKVDDTYYDFGGILPNEKFIEDLKRILNGNSFTVQECICNLIYLANSAVSIEDFIKEDKDSYYNKIKTDYEVFLAQNDFSNSMSAFTEVWEYLGKCIDMLPLVDVIGEQFTMALIAQTDGTYKVILGRSTSQNFIYAKDFIECMWYDYTPDEVALMLSYKSMEQL